MLPLLAEGGSAVEALIRATELGRFIGGFKDAAFCLLPLLRTGFHICVDTSRPQSGGA